MSNEDLIQDIETAAVCDLLAIVQDAKTADERLSQICATLADESLEILYTFVKDNIIKNYKLIIDARAPELQSITTIYPYAFLYENEMHDLFGVKFKNLTVDYDGKFYKLAKETPWNPLAVKEVRTDG
jgi:ech hydrogenase subunit D